MKGMTDSNPSLLEVITTITISAMDRVLRRRKSYLVLLRTVRSFILSRESELYLSQIRIKNRQVKGILKIMSGTEFLGPSSHQSCTSWTRALVRFNTTV